MKVTSKSDSSGADHVFSAISKEESQGISAFLSGKNVRLKNEMEEVDQVMELEDIGDEDDDMSDASIPSEDERGKKGKGKDKAVGKKAADEDDESGEYLALHPTNTSPLTAAAPATLLSLPGATLTNMAEEDGDFQDSSSDGGSPSESDSDASGDEGMASDASDPMMEEIKRKQAAKAAANGAKPKPAGAAAGGKKNKKEGSGSSSEGEKPKKKKSKKSKEEVDDSNED